MRIKFLLILILLVLPLTCLAEAPTTCFDSSWNQIRYTDENKGSVIFYVTPLGYEVTSTNLACLFGIEFLQHVNDLPLKAVIGIISSDFRFLTLLQWNLIDDYLLLIDTNIPKNMQSWTGTYIKYPEAKTRIKEILINKPFPRPNELPLNLQIKFKMNFIQTSIISNKKLVEQED